MPCISLVKIFMIYHYTKFHVRSIQQSISYRY